LINFRKKIQETVVYVRMFSKWANFLSSHLTSIERCKLYNFSIWIETLAELQFDIHQNSQVETFQINKDGVFKITAGFYYHPSPIEKYSDEQSMEILIYNKYKSYALEILWKINEKVRTKSTY